MDLAKILQLQIQADLKRGFQIKFASENETAAQLMKDLVGLFGEIGEFANLVKKIAIKLDHPEYEGVTLSESTDALRAELVDSFIYLLRIAAILDTDLESEILKKMNANKTRYEPLEKK